MSQGQQLSLTTQKWTAYQRAIFDDVARGQGHTLVLARAGSGKTTTIIEALSHVPKSESHSCLLVAFNKSVQRELQARAPRRVTVSTMHGYGYSALCAAAGSLTVDKFKTGTLLREMNAERAAAAAKAHILLVPIPRTPSQKMLLIKSVSFAKGENAKTFEDVLRVVRGLDEGDLEAGEVLPFARSVLEVLERSKKKGMRGIIDFDDMVWLPLALNLPTRKYARVFVDETQDFNRAQIELALRACLPSGRICAVGDDRQAIYRFRGADEQAVENVKRQLGAKVLPLTVTFRCAKAIVREAQEVVPDLRAREGAFEGRVERAVSESSMVARAAPGDFILSRSNAPLIGLCIRLLRRGVRAFILGSDVGAAILGLLNRSGETTVRGFLRRVERVAEEETERLATRGEDGPSAIDKRDSAVALCEGAATLAEVRERAELFSDDAEAEGVLLATTHKAKGLEADRVWVLKDTYRKAKKSRTEEVFMEEENLWYVAITRARNTLVLVDSEPAKGRNGERTEAVSS